MRLPPLKTWKNQAWTKNHRLCCWGQWFLTHPLQRHSCNRKVIDAFMGWSSAAFLVAVTRAIDIRGLCSNRCWFAVETLLRDWFLFIQNSYFLSMWQTRCFEALYVGVDTFHGYLFKVTSRCKSTDTKTPINIKTSSVLWSNWKLTMIESWRSLKLRLMWLFAGTLGWTKSASLTSSFQKLTQVGSSHRAFDTLCGVDHFTGPSLSCALWNAECSVLYSTVQARARKSRTLLVGKSVVLFVAHKPVAPAAAMVQFSTTSKTHHFFIEIPKHSCKLRSVHVVHFFITTGGLESWQRSNAAMAYSSRHSFYALIPPNHDPPSLFVSINVTLATLSRAQLREIESWFLAV